MKPNILSQRFFKAKAAWLVLAAWLATLPAAFAAIGITGTFPGVNIDDTQTNHIYSSTLLTDTVTNSITVTVNFWPTNVGGLTPLPGGVSVSSLTNYIIGPATPASAQSTLRSLNFTPRNNFITVPNTSNVVFNISFTDATGTNTATAPATTVNITATNDDPVVTASAPTTYNINDTAITNKPFVHFTISDVDDGGAQQQTVTITMSDTNNGYLSTNLSGSVASNNLVYTFTGTSAAATLAISNLVYIPASNYVAVGSTTTNTFTVTSADGYASNNATVKIIVTSINDPPTLIGASSPILVQTGTSVLPFSSMNITDPDPNDIATNLNGQFLSLSVTLTGTNVVGSIQAGGNNSGSSYSITGVDPPSASFYLRNLTYRPPSSAVSGTNQMTFNIIVTDGHGGAATNNLTLDVLPVAQAPTSSGTQTGLHVNENTTIAPISTVSLQSFNGSPVVVTVGLASPGFTNEIQGQIVNLSGFVKNSAAQPPTYKFNGSSDQATTAIRSLLFQPVPNRIPGSTNETVTFGITLGDSSYTNGQDISTTVIVTPVNDNPTITGISPLVTIQDNQTVNPFPAVLIGDVDENGAQALTVTITLDDPAKGSFSSNSMALFGFVNVSNNYTFTATNVNAAVRALTFVPVPGRVAVGLTETTTFTITVNDNHGGVVANSGTLVRVAAVSGTPVINLPLTQPFSIPLTSSNFPFQQVTIADPGTLHMAVTINNTTQGYFTAASLASGGFISNAAGIYTFSGSASNATAGIEQLNFTPSGSLVLGSTVNFTIAVTNQVPNYSISNFAVVFRQTPRSFIVTTNTDYDPSTSPGTNVTGGTLRQALLAAGPNDHITFDIRSGNPSVSDYPATIRLKAPITINNNVVFDGPGADALTISGDTDGNGVQDIQLFTINAGVTINRLAFSSGHASFAGGAFEVSSNGSLTLSYCLITNCVGDFWGGGVDVNGGILNMDHCLLVNNSTKASLGQGGGAISFYSSQPSTIANTTFAGNHQTAVNGLGGGALYVEDSNPGVEMDVNVLNCTFKGNIDAAGHGSSIRPNVFNTVVNVQNCIFNDGQGKNLEMDQSGAVISFGGNISDDSTHTIFSAGGAPVDTLIFGETNDLVNTNANLLPLTNNGGPTLTYALATNSPAIGNAVTISPSLSVLGTDVRGYLRLDGHPDSGAFEQSATNRIIIEEVLFDPAPPHTNDDFIEFYVPRDSGSVNLTGFKIIAGGVQRYVITNETLQSGQALVVFSLGAVSNSVPAGVDRQIATNNLNLDNSADIITIQNPAGQVVYQADYVASFSSTAVSDPGYLTLSNQSLVLSPQFKGDFLPFQRVVAKEGGTVPSGLSHAGYDASGKSLGVGNAPPTAFNDSASTDAQTTNLVINVLANDTDPDGTDTIRVVGVGLVGGNLSVTNSTSVSTMGATISINNSPTNGASIIYNPFSTTNLTRLPVGTVTNDTFQYTILDSNASGDHNRGSSLAETNANLAKATATVTVTVTGVNFPPTPMADGTNTNVRLTTPEDTVLDFTTVDTLIANDTDPNSDDDVSKLNIISIEPTSAFVSNSVSITTAQGATAVLDIRFNRNQTHITYDPRGSATLNALAQGQSATDTFYYTISDSHGATGTAAVNITVTGVNDGPTATPDSLATDEDHILTVPAATLLANDTDPDTGNVLTIISVQTNSAYGASVAIVGTNIVYNPIVSTNLNALSRKEVVLDTFTYTVSDGFGGTNTTTVTVTVTGVNDSPVSAHDTYTIDEDHLLTVGGLGVLANDYDPDVNGHAPDDILIVSAFTNLITSGGATVTLHSDGTFTYDPRLVFDWIIQGDQTNDSFNYVVLDHSLTIANDDVFGVQGGTTGNILKVTVNDTILSGMQGATLSISGVSAPNHGGAVTIQGTNLVYTPSNLFSGSETFTYTISDGLGGSDTANVTVQVSANTFYANPDYYTVTRGDSVLLNVLDNDVLVPASAASLSVISVGTPSANGSVSVSGVGANNFVSYTPNPTNAAPYIETFSYTTSAGGVQATGLVTVKVITRTNTLVANDDTFVVAAGSGNNILDVLVNDRALPFGSTNLTIISVETNLSVGSTIFINNAQNRLVYKPAPGLSNQFEPNIHYTISDGVGGTGTATVTIQIQPSGFFANSDTFTVTKNSQSNLLSVLANDAELPAAGQVLYIADIGISNNAPSQNGTVIINGAGTGLIYTPTNNFSGDEVFTYEISDGTTARATGQVKVHVLDLAAVNSNTNYYHVVRDSTNNPMAVLKNDYVLPKVSLPMTITSIQTNGLIGTVAISGTTADNQLLYSPKPGFIGTDTFRYNSVDANGNPGVNTVIVTVGTLVTHSDQFSVLSGTTSNALNVLANDLLLPDTTGVRLVTGFGATDHGGTLTIGPGGANLLYTPAPAFVGAEHFTYQTTDDTGGTSTDNVTVSVLQTGADRSTNSVTITVTGVNDIPTLVGTQSGFSITDKQTTMPFTNVAIADLDAHGLQLQTVTISLDLAAKGILTNLGGFTPTTPGVYLMQGTPAAVTAAIRALIFVPTENRITVPNPETTRFTISVDDSYVLSPVVDTNTTVIVTPVNDPSTITGTQGGFAISDKQTIQPFTNAVIADVDDLTIQPLTAKVIFDLAAKGILTNLGGFTSSGGGVYTMHGTASNITASLKTLVFVPTENRITVPTTEMTTLTISVDDGFVASPVTNNATTINVTAINDPSTIVGTQAGQNITDKQTLMLFTNVIVADVDDLTIQPLVVTVSLDAAVKGVLQNIGAFSNSAPGVYTFTGTASNATASIQAMVFAPTPDRIPVPTTETTTFTINVYDGFVPSAIIDTNTTVNVTSVNDAPTIVGTVTNQNITDKQTVQAFATVVLADQDELGLQQETVTVSLDNAAKGTLQNLGGFALQSPGVYVMSGTSAAITASLTNFIFVPTENRITVPTTETTTLTISMNDGFVASPVVDTNTTINVTAVNDPSTIAGVQGGFNITDKQTVQPFTNVVVGDVDDLTIQPLTARIFIDVAGKGTLQNLGGFTNSGARSYTMHGTAANITASIQALVFVPTENRITVPTTETTTLTISINDGFVTNSVTNNGTTINVTAVNDPSTITGTQGGFNITDKQTVQPFTNVVVADVDDLSIQPLLVTVQLDSAVKGTLQNIGVFSNSAPGVYSYTGTASNATVAIKGMIFVPTPNHIIVPTNEITTLTISVNDGFVPSPITDSTTTVNVQTVDDPPTITGAVAAQTITDKQTVRAFSNVTIADVDNSGLQTLAVVVTLDNSAKGTLQNLGGFSNPTPGTYTITGTPAYITANIRALNFIPTENRIPVPNTETTTFTITANDSFVAVVTNNVTTVIVTPVDEAPVIVGTQANQRVYDHASLHPFSGVTVTDVDSFGQQVLTVSVTQDLPTHGFFTSLSNFVSTGSGVITITNVTPAQATAALRGLIFVPTIVVSRLNPGAADTNRLTITANDGFLPPVLDTNTTVLSTDAYDKKNSATNGLDTTTFASALAATTNYVVAGLPNDNGAASKSGAAYIYSRNAAGPETWAQVKKLTGVESPTNTDQFGSSVSISGDTIVVGTPGTGTGVAYIFDRNTGGLTNWGESKKLVPAGGAAGDQFGAVTIYGDTIAVGSPRNGAIGSKMGAVYVYDRNNGGTTNWGQTKKLIPSDGVDSDAFGTSVALYGDTLAVGAQFNSPNTNTSFRTGGIYIYERNLGGTNNWGFVKKIVGADNVNNDQFGHAVALSTDMIIAGSPQVLTNSQKSGAAYVFMRNSGGTNNWGQVKKYLTPDGLQGAQFGTSVAVDGENIAIGLLQTTAQGGGAYLFVRNSPGLAQWSLLEKFTPPTGDTYSYYGSAVAMGGSILAANARFDDGTNALDMTYIYRLKFDDFYEAVPIPDQVGVTGTPFAFTIPAGTFSDGDGDVLVLTATNLPGWLSFDAPSWTFSGTPSVPGTNLISVTATEVDGSSVTTQFRIVVHSLSQLYISASMQSVGTNKIGTFVLTCVPGYTYRLQRAPALLNPSSSTVWTDISTAAAGPTQNSMVFYDTNAPMPSFYRVKTP